MGVLMPPHIQQKGKLLSINIHKLADLPNMDDTIIGKGGCDPFVSVKFAGSSIETEEYHERNVTLNKALQLAVFEPVMTSKINITLFDKDKVGSDDRIASFSLDYNDLKEKYANNLPVHWINIYGAPEGKQRGKSAQRMNRGLIEGSFYRGRVLLAANITNDTNPTDDIDDINDVELPKNYFYNIECDVYEGQEIITTEGNLRVVLSIGPHQSSTEEVPCKDGRISFYSQLKPLNVEYEIDLNQVPDVFITLCKENTIICYYRIKFKDLINKQQHHAPEWVDFKEEKANDILNGGVLPGSILIGLRAIEKSKYQKLTPICRPLLHLDQNLSLPIPEKIQEIKEEKERINMIVENKLNEGIDEILPTLERTNTTNNRCGTLTVTVLHIKNLEAMDRNGTSDPFVTIRVGSTLHKTSIIKKTLNPIWTKDNHFIYNEVPLSQASEIRVKVVDWEKFTKNEVIGQLVIDLRSLFLKKGIAYGEDFHNLEEDFLVSKTGSGVLRLRFSFEYIKDETKSKAAELAAERRLKKYEEKITDNFNFF